VAEWRESLGTVVPETIQALREAIQDRQPWAVRWLLDRPVPPAQGQSALCLSPVNVINIRDSSQLPQKLGGSRIPAGVRSGENPLVARPSADASVVRAQDPATLQQENAAIVPLELRYRTGRLPACGLGGSSHLIGKHKLAVLHGWLAADNHCRPAPPAPPPRLPAAPG
jgi:hypothetical protein